ncbi:hypothetical protein E2C01_062643 [Portunus trituberculatus]|uniref:Uncharacterized protein n=1 Tax=Portunus trituberculatus TaxID=210409 RepID=A0A5B7H6Y2_PORTR|nr:hypothetical protein [Portunus trituberculatus]
MLDSYGPARTSRELSIRIIKSQTFRCFRIPFNFCSVSPIFVHAAFARIHLRTLSTSKQPCLVMYPLQCEHRLPT